MSGSFCSKRAVASCRRSIRLGRLRDRGAPQAARGRHQDRGERAGHRAGQRSPGGRDNRRGDHRPGSGIVPIPVVAELPVEKDRRGRIVVDGAMRSRATRKSGRSAIAQPSPHRTDGLTPASRNTPCVRHACSPEILRGARRPAPQAVCLRHPGNDGFAGPQQGIRPARQDTVARLPGMARPAHLLPASDAGLAQAAAHRDRLELCALVSTRRRQDQPRKRGG